MISFSNSNCLSFIKEHELTQLLPQLSTAMDFLKNKKGPGSDYLGWVDLPENYDKEEFSRIQKAAQKIRKNSDVLLSVGIGGSYLGAKATIEALSPFFKKTLKKGERDTEIIFAGHQLSGSYLKELMDYLEDKDFSINIISKSGTTTEPAIAFRILKAFLEKRYGESEARERIFSTTDKHKGALKSLSDTMGYEEFVVPDDVGGRYSVLTAVGLLPIAAAGIDISMLMKGASEARQSMLGAVNLDNPALLYAATRNALLRRGYSTEILVNYEHGLHSVGEWWKQLYGESEGKDGKGIFPAAVDNTTDLHSMGQFIQDGRRNLFETVIRADSPRHELRVPADKENLDGLNFLSDMDMAEINDKAIDATILAHVDGGVPNMSIRLEKIDEKNLGALYYFFELACGLSGHLNAINPFDQPGVESYKKNMYALLGKPGFESEREALLKRLEK